MKEHKIRTDVKSNQFRFLLENGFKLIQLRGFKIPFYEKWPVENHIDGVDYPDQDPDADPTVDAPPIDNSPQAVLERAVERATTRLYKQKNVGAVLPVDVLVVDIDTRVDQAGEVNGTGIDQFRAYLESINGPSLEAFLDSTFSVRTGGGGYHVFFTYDPKLHVTPTLRHVGCPSVDLLSGVRFVVAPGSAHPSGGVYRKVDSSPLEILPAPQWLVDCAMTVAASPLDFIGHSAMSDLCGLVSPHELAAMLNAVDATRYRDYQSWFAMLAACHHATNGDHEAMGVFAEWSARDPQYASEAMKVVEAKWSTIRPTREASKSLATVRQLLSAVGRARAESAAMARLLGGPESEGVIKASDVANSITSKIVASSLETAVDHLDAKSYADWICGLQHSWGKLSSDDKLRLFTDAAKFNNLDWRKLADAIATASSGEFTRKRAEVQIRNERQRLEKEAKQAAKLQKQEELDSQLTPTALVELIADYAIEKIAVDKGSIGWAANENIYLYRDGVWREQNKIMLENICYDAAAKLVDTGKEKHRTLAQYSQLAVDTIRLKVVTENESLYARKEPPSCINLLNGTMWIEPGKAPEFKPHCREDYLTTQLPYYYDPTATCPGFITMLEQVFEHVTRKYSAQERDELIRHFFEIVGYIIQPNKNIALAWIWIGPGKNGKSRIAQILSRLVGDAWMRTDIRKLNDEKHPHIMPLSQNKLLVLDDDVKTGITVCDGTLKKISQSTDLVVNPKNKKPFSIRLSLTPLILGNSVLKVNDLSEGMTRRLNVLEWNTSMKKHASSTLPDLVEAEQMPGILNMAMAGLHRLRERGDFDPPKCCADFHHRYMEKANKIYAFWSLLDKIYDESFSTSLISVFNQYKQYMIDVSGGPPVDLQVFADSIAHLGADIIDPDDTVSTEAKRKHSDGIIGDKRVINGVYVALGAY